MTAATSSQLIQLTSENEPLYRCPGESQPVSRAIHLGRLAGGYKNCNECAWRFEANAAPTEVLAESQTNARHNIYRTRHGVRGQYINAINRSTAGQIATVLVSHLRTLQPDVDTPIMIGYTGHNGTPDLLAGVVSSVLQCGWAVWDAGRCTAASLHHALRTNQGVSYALLISGDRRRHSEVAIDIISADGQPLSVPWSDYGVSSSAGASERARQPDSSPAPDALRTLQLPAAGTQRIPRTSRRSGVLLAISLDQKYRHWLQTWWPKTCSTSIMIRCSEDKTHDRLHWLSQQVDGHLSLQWASSLTLPVEANRATRIDVHEDDRHLTVYSMAGKPVSAESLCHWINTAHRSNALHVTAHVPSDGESLQLYDAASPTSGRAQDIICDAVAIAGLIASLCEHNPPPR